MCLKDNAWLSNSCKCWRTMKPNQIYHYDGQQNLGYSEKTTQTKKVMLLCSCPASLCLGQRALEQVALLLNTRNASGRLWCAASRPALHEHLQVEVSHTKGKGISLPHALRENKYSYTWTPQSENKAMKKKALSPTGQDLHSFTQYAEDIREVPIAGTWDFHPKRGTWAQKSSLSGAESHWSLPLLSLQIPEPGEKAIETQSCWYAQKSTKNYGIPMVNLRERGLNVPTCPPEKTLWCFPKITVLKIFALPASTRHITSGEDRGRENVDNWHWGRENANNWHYFNGCGFKTSWG